MRPINSHPHLQNLYRRRLQIESTERVTITPRAEITAIGGVAIAAVNRVIAEQYEAVSSVQERYSGGPT